MEKRDLLLAVQGILPKLPQLLAEDWSTFETRLGELLGELAEKPAQERVIINRILQLFSQYEPARQLLASALEGRGDQSTRFATLGRVRHISSLLSHLLHRATFRFVDISAPSKVWKDKSRVTVGVRLRTSTPVRTQAEAELSLGEGLKVSIRIEAQGFEYLGPQEQETEVIPHKDSPALIFDLRPQEIGPTALNFDFIQEGSHIGSASVPIEIVGTEIVEQEAPASPRIQQVGVDPQPPDLTLYIRMTRYSGVAALTAELRGPRSPGISFYPKELETDLSVFVAQLFAKLDWLTEQKDPTQVHVLDQNPESLLSVDPLEIEAQLEDMGRYLWRELFPPDFKAYYAANREAWRGKTFQLVTDDPYIPWELVWPYDDVNGTWDDRGFLCQLVLVTRWLRKAPSSIGFAGPPELLPFSSLACIAPPDSGLAAARAELQYIKQVIVKNGLNDATPQAASRAKIRELLNKGGYDLLHFACHGNFYSRVPDGNSAVWLSHNEPLTTLAFAGPQIENHIRNRRPLFVLNACHSGRQGFGLTGIGGWASRLVGLGAGLFIGPQWSVTDHLALAFVKAFYDSLLQGSTLAQAALDGRLAARREGDPTWLAYSVYGHPNARITINSLEL